MEESMEESPVGIESSNDGRVNWDELLMLFHEATFFGTEEQLLFAIDVLRHVWIFAPADAVDETVANLVRMVESSSPRVKKSAAGCLNVFARSNNESLRASIGEYGGVDALLRLLQRNPRGEHQKIFAECLRNLLEFESRNREIFSRIGGLATILNIIPLASEEIKCYLLEILSGALHGKDAIRDFAFSGEVWRFVVQALSRGSVASRARAAQAIGFMTTSREILRLLVDSGTVSALLDLMRADDEEAKFLAANALGLIASDLDYTRLVAEAGSIPLYAELLKGEHEMGREIAVDVFYVLSIVQESCIEICQHLVRMLRRNHAAVKSAAVEVFLGVTWREHSISVLGETGAIPCLLNILGGGERDIQKTALRVLVRMSYNEADRRALADQGVVPVLHDLLNSESIYDMQHAVEALKNFDEDPRLRDRVRHIVRDCLFSLVQCILMQLNENS